MDAMRPVKQAGVISTHTVLHFAPVAASTGSGAALLLHLSREGFFFISARMLTYAYADLNRAGAARFYWRRFLSPDAAGGTAHRANPVAWRWPRFLAAHPAVSKNGINPRHLGCWLAAVLSAGL
jgi:hypothetical protein